MFTKRRPALIRLLLHLRACLLPLIITARNQNPWTVGRPQACRGGCSEVPHGVNILRNTMGGIAA